MTPLGALARVLTPVVLLLCASLPARAVDLSFSADGASGTYSIPGMSLKELLALSGSLVALPGADASFGAAVQFGGGAAFATGHYAVGPRLVRDAELTALDGFELAVQMTGDPSLGLLSLRIPGAGCLQAPGPCTGADLSLTMSAAGVDLSRAPATVDVVPEPSLLGMLVLALLAASCTRRLAA